jgi:hypothetical protein
MDSNKSRPYMSCFETTYRFENDPQPAKEGVPHC